MSEEQAGPAADGQPSTGFCLRRITKGFPGVRALDAVSFDIQRGEVHALVGQNGAGKSTLMKIFSGAMEQDSGDVLLDGARTRIADPVEARAQGIAIVHQEFALCPNLSVAENVFLGKEPIKGGGVVDDKRMAEATRRILARIHVDLDPNARLETLGVSEWQIVEICKALVDEPKFLILDEPTAALTEKRIDDLLNVIRRLRAAGHGIVYISHKLSEVLAIADRITVLRDGARVETVANENLTEEALVRAMTGASVERQFPEHVAQVKGEQVLDVQALHLAGAFSDVSFSLNAGEILGVTGIIGAGCHTLMRAVFGVAPADGGTFRVAGHPVRIASPNDAIAAGIGYAPADRKAESLVQAFSVYENTTMAILSRFVRWGFYRFARERAITDELIDRLSIKVSNPAEAIANLSGGNQQKVSIAKWLKKDCHVLLLEEPTRGIDVQAKAQVWKIIRELADSGVAVLVVSTELAELMQSCDRILVMRNGRLVAEYAHSEFDEHQISVKATSEA